MANEFEGMAKALQIPQKVINNIDAIDKKINQIASDSEKMATHFMSAMQRMGDGSGTLLQRLTEIQGVLKALGGTNISGINNVASGMKNAATEAEKTASAVSKAAEAMNKYRTSSSRANNTTNEDASRRAYIERYEMYKRMFDQIERNEQREIRASQRVAQQIERDLKRQEAARARLDSRMRRSNYTDYVTSTEGSLRTAGRATNYNQRAQAIKNLEAAMKRLNTADANYQRDLNRLTEAHRRLTEQQRVFMSNLDQIRNKQSNLVNTSQQLARQLALLFSVSQIEGYIMKLVQVRGEFELQNTALASILGNKEQADRLFAQITELAVQSPFTIKELTTYTKSLSAYSVEYEKLYDTTKMLADVASGLGVDMQRLILAFGQVKAANFLRGTETRQFTEAGINMLGELAKYYTELEGRIVSVSEVQDRQFRRMISFQDVEQVFKRLTSAGGMFYNMQERQAETLAGVYSNLQDKIDLMLNDIGKANDGILKGTIKTIGSILENYEVVVAAIQAAGGAFVLYKLNVLETNAALLRYAKTQGIATTMQKQLTIVQLLQVGWNRLVVGIKSAAIAMKTFAMSNLWMIGLTALATALYEIVTWNREYNKQIDEINKKRASETASLIKLSEAYDKVAKSAKNANEARNPDSDSYKEMFAQVQKLSEMLEDRGYSLPIKLEFITPDNIDEAFRGGQEILQAASDFNAEFQKALAAEMNATQGWGHIFGDNLKTDLNDLSNSYSEVGGAFKANLDILENEVIVASKGLEGAAKEYYDELRAGQREEETNTEWALRRLTLISNINDLIRIQNNSTQSGIRHERMLNDLLATRTEIRENEREVEYELNKVLNDLINKFGGLENLKKQFNENPVIIRTEIDRIFEQMELDAQTKRFAAHFAANRLQVPIELVQTEVTTPTFYNDWRDTVKTLDTEKIFDKQLQSMRSITDLESKMQTEYANSVKSLEVLNRANTKRLDLEKQIEEARSQLLNPDAQVAENARANLQNLLRQKDVIDANISAEKERQEAIKASLELMASSLNLSLVRQTAGRSGKDPMLDRFKEIIKLIEEAKKRYDELNEEFGSEVATQMVRTQFADTPAGDLIATMTFDAQGVVNGLNKAIQETGKAAQEEYRKAFQDASRPFETKLLLEPQIEKREELEQQIEDMFDQYNLSIELTSTGISGDAIKSLFGTDIIDLETLKSEILKLKPIFEAAGLNWQDVWEKTEERLTEESNKQLQERLKSYAKYLKQTVSERARIEIEAQKKIADIQTINTLSDTQKQGAISNIREEADKEKAKVIWEDFQNTDLYISMFEDLENVSTKTLEYMRQKLIEIRDTTKGLPVEDIKAINEQLDKMQEVTISRNPFQGIADNIREVVKARKEWSEVEDEYLARNEEKDFLEKSIANQEVLLSQARARYDAEVKTNGAFSVQAMSQKMTINLQEQSLSKDRERLKVIEEILKKLGLIKDNLQWSEMSLGQRFSQIGQWAGELSSAIPEIASSFEDIFGSMSDKGSDIVSTFSEVLGGVSNMATGVYRFMSGDVIGGSIQALSGLVGTIGSLFAIGDKKKERQIQRELELVGNLEKAYEKLEEAIDNAYSIDTLGKATEGAASNIKDQIDSYEEMIRLEQDKKKTDKDRIKEWEEQIEQLEEQLDEIYTESFNKVTGDILSDVLSAAENFTDAWLNAFLETGDGMQGLEDSFDDMITNMLKRQASMLITQQWIEQWEKQLEQYINPEKGDLELTTAEAKKWVSSVTSSLPQLNEALEAYFKAMEEAGVDLTGKGEGDTLTGLSKSISGLSEQQADALAALCESIRFFTSDSNAVLHSIYNFLLAPPAESPLMQELRLQTQHLASMDSLLTSVIKSSSGKGKV